MQVERFRIIGENIHCTRIYKTDGKFVETFPDGSAFVLFRDTDGRPARLPVPEDMLRSADWQAGKVRHCAAAVWQGMHAGGDSAALGRDYLCSLALRQQHAGAAFLDVNVDEFSTDIEERCRAIRWLVDLLNPVVKIPLSIDSSNTAVLRSGLERCDRSLGIPMVNSVSLERSDAITVAAEQHAAVIASAAGEKDLPNDTEGRLRNLNALMRMLKSAGMDEDAIYFDPLVFPVATDSNNARAFLDAVRGVRATFGPRIHLVGGFSNVSFGMPCRKLINQVFTRLAVEAGADGGIVDPFQINLESLNTLDAGTESFGLARALLMGEDDFGAEFIMAHRAGRLRE